MSFSLSYSNHIHRTAISFLLFACYRPLSLLSGTYVLHNKQTKSGKPCLPNSSTRTNLNRDIFSGATLQISDPIAMQFQTAIRKSLTFLYHETD